MTTRVRKTKRKVLAPSSSDEDSESESSRSRGSSKRGNKDKIQRAYRNLCDEDSSSDKQGEDLYRNRCKKRRRESKLENDDSSSSKELQEPKKSRNNLQESFDKCNLHNCSNVITPSRVNEANTAVAPAEEISFKFYIIEEIKKMQGLNNRLTEDLNLNNEYLVKKKIASIEDAKFFIHKILKTYEDTFEKLRDNRKKLIKVYESWVDDLGNKPKRAKNRFNLSSSESDVSVSKHTEREATPARNGTLEDSEIKRLKRRRSIVAQKSAAAQVASEESEQDSPMQVSDCDSDLIFSAEESRAQRKKKNDKQETTSIVLSSDQDIFESSAEVANTPVKGQVTDAKEKEALNRLLLSDNSDSSSVSEPEAEADVEDEAMEIDERRSSKKSKQHLKKQTKKTAVVCSDSSDDGDVARKRPAASLRVAPLLKQKDTFNVRNNRYYRADKKLRVKCRVVLDPLGKSVLAEHAKALKKSRDYVECKKIKSLANLDNLETKKKSAKSSKAQSDDDTAEPQKNKVEKESLVEFLDEKSDSDESSSSSSSDDKNDGETADAAAAAAAVDQSSHDDAENAAKQALLRDTSSSSEDDAMQVEDDDAKKVKKAKCKKVERSGSESEQETAKTKGDGDWRKDPLLTQKFDADETEKNNDQSQEDSRPLKKAKGTKKTRKGRRIVDSDSDVQLISNDDDEESAEEEKEEAKKKKRRAKSSDSDTSSSGKRKKSKRRRIKKVDSDSESDSKDSPGKGRKNIRKVLKDKYVTDDTKRAAQDEEDRLKRIAERQKLFNKAHEARLADEEKVEKLVLDIDEETKEELVVVDPELAKRLKPHQARGIKFMWDACFESIEQIEKSDGSGCIIAHCMGLGKTFQVVTLVHTLLSNEKTGVRTAMIVCPLSTVLNWLNEFNIWLKHVNNRDDIEIREMTKLKKNVERKHELEQWQKYGGVLIIGYEMFRNLTGTGKKMKKNMKDSVMKSLVDPGADLVVCDEGHLLKNEDSALSKAMRQVRTMRRIVLTGTPLQNNLKEYHCMVQFVKPNLLGTKKEFLNRFVNPITNGQFDDSTPYDVKLMKKRAHVLHKMLEGSVQRFDYNVLTPFLPPKAEYVIFVRLTAVQIKMYQHYLDNFSRRFGGRNVSLFADFQALQRIWTHPYVLLLNAEKVERANEKKRLEASDSEGSLRDFIDDDTSASESSASSASANDSDVECLDSDSEKGARGKKRGTRANPLAEEPEAEAVVEVVEEAWWKEFVDDEKLFDDLRISTKLMLLFAILKECESIGDKVLVFSQSLYSLTCIEHFLNLMDEQNQSGGEADNLNGHTGRWSLGMDYFRLDGSTSAENRSIWSKIFNNPKNTRARLFLISTRAGGLGINLIGANRVIIFDASWNPSHDVQSIFRIYRFGQLKPCYVYRFLAAGTMEEKIYNRQVTKLSLACRVVDEQQIERHYSNTDLAELYQFDTCEDQTETLGCPKDRLLAEIFIKYQQHIVKCHEHDSLLENKEDEELDEEERKQAWAEYEEEKKGIRQHGFNAMGNNFAFNQMLMNMNAMPEFQGVKQLLQKDYPDVPPEHLDAIARQTMLQMYNSVDQQAVLSAMNSFQNPLMAPAQNPTIQGEIFRQQNVMMNQQQAQPNYYGVNHMPTYSGRGRPPKYTSVNNQIVNNPMFAGNAQAMQPQVPIDNDIQVLNQLLSGRQTTPNSNN